MKTDESAVAAVSSRAGDGWRAEGLQTGAVAGPHDALSKHPRID